MRKQINIEQEEEAIRLYQEQKYSIKQIMKLTGISSGQTIYRILDTHNIDRLRVQKPVHRIAVNLDAEAYDILSRINPKNVSKFVCDMIKKGCQ